MDWLFVFSLVFLASLISIIAIKRRIKMRGGERVEAQFVVTGTIMMIFYIVCFCSGLCTIFNFFSRFYE
jgi:hypothetical protein